MKYTVENEKIGFRNTLREEIESICEMESQQENQTFILAYSRERHLQVLNNPDEEHFTVWDKQRKELIGFVILAGLENPHRSLEFRRVVIRDKGKGFGRQCLRLIKHYCFEVLIKFHRVWLDVFEDNHRAIYLYKSEGFQEEGRLRDAVRQGENFRSLLLLSMIEHEYR